MTPAELQDYLHAHIPLSAAMRISVMRVDEDGVTLGAPLEPNINHRDTLFGGSASAAAILAAWSLLHCRLSGADISGRLVIQRNTMHYEQPVSGAFTARSFLARPDAWEPFLRMLTRKGRARITVGAVLEFAGETVGRFEGEFVALT